MHFEVSLAHRQNLKLAWSDVWKNVSNSEVVIVQICQLHMRL